MSKVWTNQDVLFDEKIYLNAMVEHFNNILCGENPPTVAEMAKYAREKLGVECKKTTGWLSPRTAGIILRKNGFNTHHTRRGSTVTFRGHCCGMHMRVVL